MTWLAIDTATSRASVAFGAPGREIVEESLDGARQHARALIPMVERLLARAGQTLGAVHGVVVADGPGSFTGLRVSAAFAKALAGTRGLPLRTAPSLLVRSAAQAEDGATVLAITDALRGDVYLAAYRFSRDAVAVVVPPGVVAAADAGVIIDRADRVVGNLPPALEELAGARYGGSSPPSAGVLIGLLNRQGATTSVDDIQFWEPLYGRPAEAQAKWEREHGRALPRAAGPPG